MAVAEIRFPKLIIDGHDLSHMFKSVKIDAGYGQAQTFTVEFCAKGSIDKDGNVTIEPL